MKNKEINDLLEAIFIKYRKQIYLLALQYLREESHAEDIVQDTMIRIRKKIVKKDITSCHKLGVLLGYIVRGLCLNHLKKNQKMIYREIYDEEIQMEDTFVSEIILNDTINKLPDEYRDIFIMKFVKDMSYKEIANDLNLNEATVRKRMERARNRVKQILGGDNNE